MLTGTEHITAFFAYYICNSAHNKLRALELDQIRKKSNMLFHALKVVFLNVGQVV